MLKTSTDPKMRAYLLSVRASDILATLYRQTMFAEYEKITHALVESSTPLTVENLRSEIVKLVNKDIAINIKEERKVGSNALLAAENVAMQLERRVAFRRAMKKVIQGAQKAGAKGIKICVAGRLGGAEMARTEWYLEGRVPLHTLRARIDYGFAEAHTTYGNIGIKVWIFKGEILQKGIQAEKTDDAPKKTRRPRRGK